MSKAGEFEIDVSDPFPVWCRLRHSRSGKEICFTHRELDDLEYATKKAKKEAKHKLREIKRLERK